MMGYRHYIFKSNRPFPIRWIVGPPRPSTPNSRPGTPASESPLGAPFFERPWLGDGDFIHDPRVCLKMVSSPLYPMVLLIMISYDPNFERILSTFGFVWKCCVPLNPMVLLIIIPFLNGYFMGNIPYFQTNPNNVGKTINHIFGNGDLGDGLSSFYQFYPH